MRSPIWSFRADTEVGDLQKTEMFGRVQFKPGRRSSKYGSCTGRQKNAHQP